MLKTVIIGDIGGNYDLYIELLKRIKINEETLKLPKNVKIVNVGDVIRLRPHFKENNNKLIELTKKLIENNPKNFCQILGNHESGLLGGTKPDLPVEEYASPEKIEILQTLWNNRKIKLATQAGDNLITHAGLTCELWKNYGASDSLPIIVKKINSTCGFPIKSFEKTGYIPNKKINEDNIVSVFWTESNIELFQSWYNNKYAPFSQIFGHCSPYDFNNNKFIHEMPKEIEKNIELDFEGRISTWDFIKTIETIDTTIIDDSDEIPLSLTFRCCDWTLGDTIVKNFPENYKLFVCLETSDNVKVKDNRRRSFWTKVPLSRLDFLFREDKIRRT